VYTICHSERSAAQSRNLSLFEQNDDRMDFATLERGTVKTFSLFACHAVALPGHSDFVIDHICGIVRYNCSARSEGTSFVSNREIPRLRSE